MRRYETIFIVRPNAGEDDITALITRAEEIIARFNGTVIKLDKWGLRKLAYTIKKDHNGFYVYVDYTSDPEAVAEIERVSKFDDRILKFMTIKTSENYVPGQEKEAAPVTAPDAEVEAEWDAEAIEEDDDEQEIESEDI